MMHTPVAVGAPGLAYGGTVAAAQPTFFTPVHTCGVRPAVFRYGSCDRSWPGAATPGIYCVRYATGGKDCRSATACRRGWLPCRVKFAPGRISGRASGRVFWRQAVARETRCAF